MPNEKIELRIPDLPLAGKLDLIAATIEAVYEAHRDTMSTRSWACLHQARDKIMEALLAINDDQRRLRNSKPVTILKLDVPKSV